MRKLETGSFGKSVRGGTAVPRARSTQVERALRARFSAVKKPSDSDKALQQSRKFQKRPSGEEASNYGGFMRYVDGYVLPLPKKNLQAYRRMAQKAGKIWRKHGALDYKECAGEDLKKTQWSVPFSRMMKLKSGETVVFAYIVFKSRAHRDRVNAKVMKDPRLTAGMQDKPMPFDMKRMVYGGFKVLVDV